MMKSLMAAAAAVGLMVGASAAHAEDPIVNLPLAASANLGVVALTLGLEAGMYDSNRITDGSFKDATGVFNISQNNGANAVTQNSVALSSVLGCECDDTLLNVSVAAGVNAGAVVGSIQASFWGNNRNTISDSFSGATGLFNISQNNGASALTQNAIAVSSITH